MTTNVEVQEYGSDQTGLIYGYIFSPGQPGRPLDSSAALQWLARGPVDVDKGFVWLHFNLASAATENWLKDNLTLSDVFLEALHDGPRSTRVEYVDGTLIAVINDVHYDFSFDVSEISTLWLSLDDRIMVSARTKPLRAIERLRASVKAGEAFRSSIELLVHLLRDQADVLIQIVRSIIAKVDEIEDKLLAERLDHRRANLGQLRRLLVRLQRLLAPEPAALFRLLGRPPGWMAEFDVQELRQSTEEFSVALNDLTALQERIKLLQEEIAARINEQTSRSLFVLTIVTVLALPINIIAGLLGMNVGGIPFAQQPHGFWIVIVIVATFTVVAGWLAFRNRQN
jgi:zinc transporter